MALAIALGGLAAPQVASAADPNCVHGFSRIPMSGVAPVAAPPSRAMMARGGVAASPAKAAKPRLKAKRAAVRRAHAKPVRVRKAVHHPRPKAAKKAIRVAAAPAPRRGPAPTPMAAAARDLATPATFALIATTICETGPAAGPRAYSLLGGPPAAALPPEVPGVGRPDEVVPVTFFPPVGPPPDEEPIILFPPGQPPVGPPVVPPVGPPLTPGAVPEPGTWALMILGFGLVGAALRRRSNGALARRR
jgi:hypothetical protein